MARFFYQIQDEGSADFATASQVDQSRVFTIDG
jgi:hypothetical protein